MDEVIYANARQAGNDPNIARQITYKSGIPEQIPAFTVNKACASGIKTVVLKKSAATMYCSNFPKTLKNSFSRDAHKFCVCQTRPLRNN
ncbi:MAG: hypothetical protein HY606_09735 [Planctomycetes bacterium]|nr:hypothetical protein [Planctomycetota bacterium]